MVQLRDTKYAKELSTGSVALGPSDEGRMERLFVKGTGIEEIRFSWWKDGRMARRPLDLPEEALINLFQDAIGKGVFTANFRAKLQAIL